VSEGRVMFIRTYTQFEPEHSKVYEQALITARFEKRDGDVSAGATCVRKRHRSRRVIGWERECEVAVAPRGTFLLTPSRAPCASIIERQINTPSLGSRSLWTKGLVGRRFPSPDRPCGEGLVRDRRGYSRPVGGIRSLSFWSRGHFTCSSVPVVQIGGTSSLTPRPVVPLQRRAAFLSLHRTLAAAC
jgi:hypothetical protein